MPDRPRTGMRGLVTNVCGVSKTVLVVDDSAVQAMSLRMALEGAGYRVLSAHEGKAALEMISAEPPDLVITDVIMPVMDGYELSRQIKGNDATAKIPVIIISGLGETSDPYWRKHADADAYLAKTAGIERLLETVADMLAQPPA
ncbi:MAG: response regulator [Candidatus Eremiobacteraeota bacterium]|nr:response regulator [Candidatus Eremiobacteraeota bacterium]